LDRTVIFCHVWIPPTNEDSIVANEKRQKNNQRSNDKNPNNPAHQHALDNRSNQLNPNHPEYKGGAPKPRVDD
jgi:hypothetical protein